MNQQRLTQVILAPIVSEKSNVSYVSLAAGQELDLEAAAAAADKE